jgi:hypothetical protein
MDEKGINRFATPARTVCAIIITRRGAETDDRELIRILHAKTAGTYDLQLLEGRTGVFKPSSGV